MRYTLCTVSLTSVDAANFRRTLKQYEIDITTPDLFARWDGWEKRIKFADIDETIAAMMRRDIKAAADRGEELKPDPADYKPDWFELDFKFVDVSTDRLAWAETLVTTFCRLNQWAINVTQHEQRPLGEMPIPLGYAKRSRIARLISPSRTKRKSRRSRLRLLMRELAG